ncbi:serine hydrolase [Plantactinospora soyae]|uniref:CubicO group peptidase (Beta-lactamase class C family) n=1 Tax=Plantactinospora soyae TaxID=1544732 RepID=A0A927R059_9ACTN|nr:serine hydrolase [Plantactinospora soyae]MBE1489827.1 CubicO group peptidase (beta-lactamase class C family) [Plantactinospora soyae]
MSEFAAYHQVDGVTHQRRFDELAGSGFRPVVLNVSGDPDDPRYAAVWVRRPGPDWRGVHGLSAPDYQACLDELSDQGFAPTVLSVVGPLGAEVFAAVFEQRTEEQWFARQGLGWDLASNPDSLAFQQRRAYDEGYLPRCLAVYGDASDRRFAGVWVRNSHAVPWSWWWTDSGAYRRFFAALVDSGQRPAVLSVAGDGRLLSVFHDDGLGEWHARHEMSASAYQQVFDAQNAEGRRPVVLAAGGVGDWAQYAGVFAADDVAPLRSWNVTGGDFAGADDLDAALRRFMVHRGIRSGSVAIGRDGTIVASRGYTWAEPDYPITAPGTTFRIASLSKIFTAAALSRLVEAGRLAWSTPAFPFVGITSPLPAGTPVDPAADAITVGQLVLRTSRLPRDFGRQQRELATQLGVPVAPVPTDVLLRYLYGLPLAGEVPPGGLYSNAAFHLLTEVVERASGLPFVGALDRYVLAELGIRDVAVARTAVRARQPGEVVGYDHADVRASQLDFAPDALAPNAYGGEMVLETALGSGGLITSAPSIARVIARYPVWNADDTHLTGREVTTRFGAFDGTSSGATSRRDGLDFAFLFNRRVADEERVEIRNAINVVLNTHGGSL